MRSSILALFLLPTVTVASSSRFFTFSNYGDWADGSAEGVEIWAPGGLAAAAKLDSMTLEGEDYIWDLTVGADGSVYLATGGKGRVYVFQNGETRLFFDSPENDVLTVLEDDRGEVWIGCSPDGLIYRLAKDGSLQEEFQTGQSSIWCLAKYKNGVVAGTGPEGRIFHCRPGREASELAETAMANVMSLLPLPKDELLVAGASPGAVQRINEEGHVFTVAQLDYEELRNLCFVGEDSVAFLALDPAAGTKGARAVVMEGRLTGPFRTLWASPDSLLLELLNTGNALLTAGGWPGRAYLVEDGNSYARIAEIGRQQVLCMGWDQERLYLGSGSPACFYWLAKERVPRGQWTSSALDAKIVATWGRVRLMGPKTDKVTLSSRSGNLGEPGIGWSPWVEASESRGSWRLLSPEARYLQVRVEIVKPQSSGIPPVELMDVSYRPRNSPPILEKLNLLPKGKRPPGVYRPFSTTVPTHLVSSKTEKKTSSEPEKEPPTTDRYLAWEAKDPDADQLTYALWFRSYPRGEWVSLAEYLDEPYWALTEGSLAEGWFSFRVEASDGADNPPSSEMCATRVIGPLLIDDVPPRITAVSWQETGDGYQVTIEAEDNGSGVVQASVSVDGKSWRVLEPEDGVADSERELFTAVLEAAHASVTVRLKDRAGNAASQNIPLTE